GRQRKSRGPPVALQGLQTDGRAGRCEPAGEATGRQERTHRGAGSGGPSVPRSPGRGAKTGGEVEVRNPFVMPRIPIFKLGSDEIIPPALTNYTPSLSLEGLAMGVDNLRHDVHLSPKFTEAARAHIARLLARHGDVDGLLAAESPQAAPRTPFLNKLTTALKPGAKAEPS